MNTEQRSIEDTVRVLEEENKLLREEIARLCHLIDTPRTDEFFEAVKLEAAHQNKRWGVDHDAGKTPADWFWLLGYLSGKALNFPKKRKHHIISSAAMLLNWWRAETGISNAMRPGIDHPKGENDGGE